MNTENPDGDNLYLAQSLTSTNEITTDFTSDQSTTPVNIWDDPIYIKELNESLATFDVCTLMEPDEDSVVITGAASTPSVDQPVL